MQPSRHLIVVGVGVLVAFGNAPPGLSEPLPSHSPAIPNADELLQPFSLQESTASVEAASLDQPRIVKSKIVPTENIALTAIAPEFSRRNAQTSVAQRTTAIAPSSKFNPSVAIIPEPKKAVIAQTNPSTTPNLAPLPSSSQQQAPTTTQPPLSTPDPGPSRPLGPAKPGIAPEYLNPDPNPLSFPTKPEEVKLRGIQPITLQQAIELAQRNNRSLQVTRLQLERSKAALRQSQAASFPTLSVQSTLSRSLSANSGRNQNNALSELLGGSSNDESAISNAFSASATLSYDIFTSGQRPANIRAAERQLRSDELQVEISQEQLRLDVAGDYYNLQQSDESVRIQQSSVRNNEASLRDTQALERAGLGTRFDVLQSEVQLANSRQNLTNAIAQQQISRRQLAQRLSLSPAIDLAAADPVDVAGEWNLSLEESIVLALKNRAELEQQLVQREQAQQQRRAALAGLGPTVTAQAQYQLSDILDDDSRIGDGYAFQLGVNWNLYDGGASVAQAQQAEANIAIAEQNFADQSNQVRFAVEQGYANLLSNFENIGTTTRALGQAQEALRLARLRFQAGVGTSTDTINAENALTTAEGNRVNAIIGYNRSLATLERAVTHLPIPTGATTPSLASPPGGTPATPLVPSTTTPGTTPPTTPPGATPSTTTPPSNSTP
ncbi:MAG: TolC family protein [Tildeniella nuda ZEHNDER 1965/U140]|jgi:OMF family outer membrane factor|nr:TolC family protein [Tildeniella nuda ZEHNDER 1965/U140]